MSAAATASSIHPAVALDRAEGPAAHGCRAQRAVKQQLRAIRTAITR
jgi:hypothetical protein